MLDSEVGDSRLRQRASRRAAEQSAAKLALEEAHRLVPQLVKRSRAERTGKTRKQATPPDPQLSLRLKE